MGKPRSQELNESQESTEASSFLQSEQSISNNDESSSLIVITEPTESYAYPTANSQQVRNLQVADNSQSADAKSEFEELQCEFAASETTAQDDTEVGLSQCDNLEQLPKDPSGFKEDSNTKKETLEQLVAVSDSEIPQNTVADKEPQEDLKSSEENSCKEESNTIKEKVELVNDTVSDSEIPQSIGAMEQPQEDLKTSEENENEEEIPTAVKVAFGIAAAGTAAVVAPIPVALAAAKFTTAGVAVGSLASSFWSWKNSIPVSPSNMISTLQTAGAAGLGALGFGAAAGVGVLIGSSIGTFIVNGEKREIPIEKLKDAFDKNDSDSDGIITYDELIDTMIDLDLNPGVKDLKMAYKSATAHNKEGPIGYIEYLKIFGIEPKPSKWEEAFIKYDTGSTGFISFENFEDIMVELDLNPGIKELKDAYKNATGRTTKQEIGYKEYLKILEKLHK